MKTEDKNSFLERLSELLADYGVDINVVTVPSCAGDQFESIDFDDELGNTIAVFENKYIDYLTIRSRVGR